MNLWRVMLFGSLITTIRLCLIYLFGRLHIPETVRQALRLRYLPPAV